MAPTDNLTTVLFDFNATLAWGRDNEAWVRAARQHAGRSPTPVAGTVDGHPRGLHRYLNHVWHLARRRDPSCSWDLSASAHRRAFTTVLTQDLGCAEWLATALYDVLPNQWELYDDTVDVLTTLRRAGRHLGIVSNIGLDIRPRLATLHVLPLFSSVVLSFEVGAAKPDPAIFAVALRDLATSPAHTLMVGDTWDQDGAAAAIGITTLILPARTQATKGLAVVLDICGVR